MKIIIYVSISLIILGCDSTGTAKNTAQENNTFEKSDSVVSQNNFDNCFVEPDSSYTQEVIGCSGGYYKLLNGQYVLRISSEKNVEYGDCDILSINFSEQTLLAELIMK
jgi:hypothetical protein